MLIKCIIESKGFFLTFIIFEWNSFPYERLTCHTPEETSEIKKKYIITIPLSHSFFLSLFLCHVILWLWTQMYSNVVWGESLRNLKGKVLFIRSVLYISAELFSVFILLHHRSPGQNPKDSPLFIARTGNNGLLIPLIPWIHNVICLFFYISFVLLTLVGFAITWCFS